MAWSKTDLANRVVSSLSYVLVMHKIWSIYLISKDFDNEPELRNKIFPIYFCGLIETAVGFQSRYNEIIAEATKQQNYAAIHYMNLANKFVDGVIDVFSDFSENELVFIREMRNQYVHGILNGHLNSETMSIFRLDSGVIKDVKLHKEDYRKMHREYIEQFNSNIDDALSLLRDRLCNSKKLFWVIICSIVEINMNLVSKEIIEYSILKNSNYKYLFVFLNDSYKETSLELFRKGELMSLADIRKNSNFDSPSGHDNVFAEV